MGVRGCSVRDNILFRNGDFRLASVNRKRLVLKLSINMIYIPAPLKPLACLLMFMYCTLLLQVVRIPRVSKVNLKEVKTFPSRCWSDCLNPFLQGRRTPRAHSPPLLRRLRLNWRIWNRPRTRSTNCSCGLPACRRTMRSRYRENTSLRSRQLVSVRRYGRVIQWKSRWNFTSSASSIFLVKVLRLSTEFLG